MTRAMSTVVDVTLCLLFVGAALAAIVGGSTVDPPETGNTPATTADRLGTETAGVEYTLAVPGTPPAWVANATARHQRTAHGTVAELLGEAAMSSVTIDGMRLSKAGRHFEQAVRATTRHRLRNQSHQTAVRVDWEPYPNASVSSEFRVGNPPPPAADVRAATLTVPSGMRNATEPALDAARTRGYRGVATVVARTVVDGLFPPDQTELALRGDYPADVLMAKRYQQMAKLSGVGPLAVTDQSTVALNQRLTASLAERIESELRAQFSSPTAAARAVTTDTIRITVRTWSV